MSTVVFVHADPFVPACQTTLVRRALDRTFPAGSFEVTLTSTLSPPPAWNVPASVARSMLAKLETLRRAGGALYLDARLIIATDLRGLVDIRGALADALPLRTTRLLWVAPDQDVRPADAARTYDQLAEDVARGVALAPEPWRPTLFGADPDARVVDATARGDRPWVSPFAPAAAPWLRSLREALAAGVVTRDELRADLSAGLLRPSLLPQLDLGLEDARRLPAELLAQDVAFPFAELSPSAEQRALLASPGFEKHMRDLRRLNRRLVKESKQPDARDRFASPLLALPRRLLRRALGEGRTP